MLSVLAALALSASGGEVSGRVVVAKKLTKKKIGPLAYNLRGAPVSADAVAADAGEYSRIAVVLEGASREKPEPVTAILNQKDKRFNPELLIVPVGSVVSFPNEDPLFHNVFSLSRTRQFDLGYYPQGQTRTVKFDRPGVVQVYCHLHPNMYSAVLVTESPWQLRPDEDGRFYFQNVPDGEYALVVWHNTAGLFRRKVRVQGGASEEVVISIPVEVPRP
jgi:plastocyanin